MKHSLVSILIILITIQISYSQSFKPVDFEAGGCVTEVYRQDIGTTKMLFARTDIGGVYSSIYDENLTRWSDWTFLNTFAYTQAGLHVQGFLPNDGSYLICCGTHYLNNETDRGLWKYLTSTGVWSKRLDINYGGNVLHSKIGGECIVKHEGIIYTGGRTYSNQNFTRSTLYRSVDGGWTWTDINPYDDNVTGHVSSIVVNPINPNIVWVGTDEGVWKGDNIGGEFVWTQKIYTDPPDEDYYKLPYLPKPGMKDFIDMDAYNTPVHRIIISPSSQYIFVTLGNEIWRSTNSGQNFSNDITNFFDAGGEEIISAVNLFDGTKLLVSRIDKPTKISSYYGNEGTWSEDIPCSVEVASQPKHICTFWDDKLSWSKTNFTLGELPDEWYCSGPYNLYCLKDHNFTTTKWEFMDVDKPNYTHGINFTVVYDVTFGKGSNPYVYVPIADLVEARIEKQTILLDDRIHILDYARQKFDPEISEMCDTYMSNATRVLVSENNDETVYLIGGNIFYKKYERAILRSTNQGDRFNKPIQDGLDPSREHCIIDGLISDSDENYLVVLVGGGEYSYQLGSGTDRGVFWSSNGGDSFTRSSGISSDAYVDEIFAHQTNLAQDPNDENIMYLYLEGRGNGAHFYRSVDKGKNWQKTMVEQFPDIWWHNKGCLAATNDNGTSVLFLAMAGSEPANGGLFKSLDQGDSWERIGNWYTAHQIAARDNILYIFGNWESPLRPKRIYRSDDFGNTISFPYTTEDYRLPSTSHLTIDPSDPYILWVSTSGQGIYRIDTDGGDELTDNQRMNNVPFNYSLEQNYPNPFNPSTTIYYSIKQSGLVTLSVYDVLGKEIATLVNEMKNPGNYNADFNSDNLSSGAYFYRLEVNDFIAVKRMLLVK